MFTYNYVLHASVAVCERGLLSKCDRAYFRCKTVVQPLQCYGFERYAQW